MSFFTSAFRNPIFSQRVAVTFPVPVFATLANTSTAISDVINNSVIRYPQMILNINCAGTAAATAWLDARLLISTDAGLTFATWESGISLPFIPLNVTPQVYHTRIMAPEYFKIAIMNNTGQVLTAGTVFYQGVRA